MQYFSKSCLSDAPSYFFKYPHIPFHRQWRVNLSTTLTIRHDDMLWFSIVISNMQQCTVEDLKCTPLDTTLVMLYFFVYSWKHITSAGIIKQMHFNFYRGVGVNLFIHFLFILYSFFRLFGNSDIKIVFEEANKKFCDKLCCLKNFITLTIL